MRTQSFAFLTALGCLLGGTPTFAQEDLARGQQVYETVCAACHNPELIPPQGPPMFGVQRRYLKQYGEANFSARMIDFVQHPTMEKVVMKKSAASLGLMPAMPLPEADLRAVAAFIRENQWEPPCTHWEHAIAHQSGGGNHSRNEQRNYNRLCR